MRQSIEEFFYFTRKERIGVLVLLLVSTIGIILPRMYHILSFKGQDEIRPLSLTDLGVALIIKDSIPPLALDTFGLFQFDPNTASEKDFLQLGLPERTIRSILNYRKKGGQFQEATDFKKIYTLDSIDYMRLFPFIKIHIRKNENAPLKAIAVHAPIPSKTTLKAFNPNTASRTDLEGLGIPQKIVQTILNYREKGGRFRIKEDLQKIYGLEESLYHNLAPFIQLEEKTLSKQYYPKKSDQIKIDINIATEADWQKLRGIGNYRAKKIIEFRTKLGGFQSVAQVGETFGLPDSVFQAITPQLIASPILSKIDLNRATIEQLQKHPYISWRQARIMVNYRNQHGAYQHLDTLNKVLVFSPEWLKKVKPYLKISN